LRRESTERKRVEEAPGEQSRSLNFTHDTLGELNQVISADYAIQASLDCAGYPLEVGEECGWRQKYVEV